MAEKDSFVKRVVSALPKTSDRGTVCLDRNRNRLVLSEAQIAFSESQTQWLLAPANRVFRYRNHEDMNRDMDSWVVKTMVHVQKTRNRNPSV